jgi:uncharacterized membrane protein
MDEKHDLARITAFTDGVMAVAITLLVLNLKVPDLATYNSHELVRSLGHLGDDALAYAFSFALVGRYWWLHHRLFERLRGFDGQLMALNLLFLALIALMPFTAELQARYGDLAPADAVFAGTLGAAALTHWRMSVHAENAGLEHTPEPDKRTSPFMAVLFLVSIPVAFLSTITAQAMWVGSMVVRRYGRRRLGRSSATSE